MSSLLNRAESDIQIARLLLSPQGNPTNDEMITDQAAYHTQQAIEKALKYQVRNSILKRGFQTDIKAQQQGGDISYAVYRMWCKGRKRIYSRRFPSLIILK